MNGDKLRWSGQDTAAAPKDNDTHAPVIGVEIKMPFEVHIDVYCKPVKLDGPLPLDNPIFTDYRSTVF